jgi:hypothetical protein
MNRRAYLFVLCNIGAVLLWNSALTTLVEISVGLNISTTTLPISNFRKIMGAEATRRLTAKPTSTRDLRLIEYLSRRALLVEPLQDGVLRTHAIIKSGLNKDFVPVQAMLTAIKVSRRDVPAQFWMIEYQVNQQDVAGALNHYNAALSTSDSSRGFLFQRLAPALIDKEIREPFRAIMKRDPFWINYFLYFALEQNGTETALADLLVDRRTWKRQSSTGIFEQVLIRKFLVRGRAMEARKFYLGLKGAQPALLRSPSFSELSSNNEKAALGWEVAQLSSSGARFDRAINGALVLSAFAAPGARAVIARKPLFLIGGRHELRVTYGEVLMPDGSELIWKMRCVEGGELKDFWQQSVNAASSQKIHVMTFNVPLNCQAQSLDIEIAGAQRQAETDIEVTAMQIS